MIRGLMFNSNEKTNCYCCIKLCQPDSDEAAYPCGSLTPPSPTVLSQPAQPQITSAASKAAQNECALRPGPMLLPWGGQSRHFPPSGETQPQSPTAPGDLRVSLIMTQVQKKILPLLPQPRRAFDLTPHSSTFFFFFFLEILIRSNDRHDEFEAALPDNMGVKNERLA